MLGHTGAAVGAVAGAVSGGALLAPAAARAAGLNARGAELATLHDLSRCVGCGACVEACRESNAAKFPEPETPFPRMYPARVKAEDFSERRDEDDRLTPYNWLYVQSCTVEHAGRTYDMNMPRRCMHCQNPPCANLCPWGAAGRDANGIVRINDQVCLGGAKCRSVCPWKIPQRQTGVGLYLDILPGYAGNGVMYKCDRCHQLVEQGEVPACIAACPYEVQTIGPRHEIVAKAHALAEAMHGYIYGETENGGTNTLYVSPVPFEAMEAALQADRAIDQAQGRPNLKRYGDPFAGESALAKAALLAPVAGVVGGLLSLGGKVLGRGAKPAPDDKPRDAAQGGEDGHDR
ncbi:MAG: 4Fe-4S dicluster domain-containing protein [Desulfovibrionaceae bacterium]